MSFKVKNGRENKTVKFSSLLSAILKNIDAEDEFYLEILKDNWQDICGGEIIAMHSAPIKIIDGLLIIKVDHSIFANELNLMSVNIIDKVKSLLGDVVWKIKIETGTLQ